MCKLLRPYNQSSQKIALNVSLILANANDNKKAVPSQRWPRDARYISRSWAVAEIWPFEIIQDGGGHHLESVRIENSAIRDPPSPKTPPYNQTWSGSDDRLRRYGHLKFFKDCGGRHLGFVRTGNSAIRSAVPKNSTLEQNMKWIGRPVAEISPLEIFQHGGGRHLGFVRTVNSDVRSANPENPTLEPNMKWIGSPEI